MSALANRLRMATAEAVRELSPDARIALALALGDDDVTLYCAATGATPDVARRVLSRARQLGRQPSTVARQ